jgi:hypothetical protein
MNRKDLLDPNAIIAEARKRVAFEGTKCCAAEALAALEQFIRNPDRGNIPCAVAVAVFILERTKGIKPSKNSTKPFDAALDWVASACAGTKDHRDYMKVVTVTDGYLYGSDGHTLHRALNDGSYKPGVYTKAGEFLCGADESTSTMYPGKFPVDSAERLLEGIDDFSRWSDPVPVPDKYENRMDGKTALVSFDGESWYQRNYITAAVRGYGKSTNGPLPTYRVSRSNPKHNAIVISHANGDVAMVMPYRVEE